VQHALSSRGFSCERPSKKERQTGRTPDFRVYRDDRFCFFAEVKSLRGDSALDDVLAGLDPFHTALVSRNDPTFNRITAAIHSAAGQFDALNPDHAHPNVLALVNYEQICDARALHAVLTGFFFADDGTRHRIYEQFSDGRMIEDRKRIDLYLWLNPDDESDIQFLYGNVNQQHHLV